MAPKPFIVNERDCELEGWEDASLGPVQWRTLVSGERTPSETLTMGVAVVRRQTEGRPKLHRHAQAETYFILSGRGSINLAGEERPLVEGDAVFIPGGDWHVAWCTGEEPLRILYVLAADTFDQVVYEFGDEV
jgi:mannose-6-phosphate isomerase-like protein (cupin superfamily)